MLQDLLAHRILAAGGMQRYAALARLQGRAPWSEQAPCMAAHGVTVRTVARQCLVGHVALDVVVKRAHALHTRAGRRTEVGGPHTDRRSW